MLEFPGALHAHQQRVFELKKLFLGLSVVLALACGSAFIATQDRDATHPTLKSAALPPLIPTRAFFANAEYKSSFVVSGDGTYLAFEKGTLTDRHIAVTKVGSDETIAELPIGLAFLRWHPTKPLVRFIFEGSDWEVDPYSPARKNWKRISPVKLSGGWVKNRVASTEDMTILTWGKAAPRDAGDMWLVSQDGLTAEKVAEGNEKTVYWVFDTLDNPVLRLDSLDPATQRLFRKTDTGWRTLVDIALNDEFYPVSAVREDGTVLARSARGRDKVALVSMNVDTGVETVEVENARGDIGLPTNLTLTSQPDVIRLGSDTQDRIALTERGEAFLEVLGQFPQPVSLGPTTPSASGRYVTQAISSQSKSEMTLLIDLQERSYVTLAEHVLRKYQDHFVQEQAVTFTARDGLEIPAIMTLPKGVTGPVPFLVYVHGGPAQHVSLGYGHFTQMLVNRGYGVLSVNFRGSTGFGKAFQAAGFRQFGRAMQDDITDAAGWLVQENLADPEALAVMGESYGGYSSALAMTRDPDLFKAAIVEFPMLDVEFQSRHHPGFWDNSIDLWWRYFGQVDVPEELELMRKYSPSNLVEDIHGPILMLGGVRDEITAIQQVRDFEAAAKAADKPVQVHYFENAGHGVSEWRDYLKRARLIEEFLAEQLGGRSGGFELAERAPAFFD